MAALLFRPDSPRSLTHIVSCPLSLFLSHCHDQSSHCTAGIRTMMPADVPSACELLNSYLSKFKLAPVMDNADFAHWLLPRHNVVDSFVVVNGEGRVTDMCRYEIERGGHPNSDFSASCSHFYYPFVIFSHPIQLLPPAFHCHWQHHLPHPQRRLLLLQRRHIHAPQGKANIHAWSPSRALCLLPTPLRRMLSFCFHGFWSI